MSRQLARRRRRERMGGAAVAVLGIAVAVVAILAVRNPGHRPAALAHSDTARTHATVHSTPPSPSPTPTPSPSASPTPAQPAVLPLVVLNNTTITGLAAQAAQRFRAGGWTVTTVGNYRNDILSTCAYYDPAVAGAQQAASALQVRFPQIKRVEPKFAQLPPGPIVVVLTPDYT